MKVDDYDKLKQYVSVEFKRGVSAEIRVHLDEQKVKDLKSAAVLADDYALTHKKGGFSDNKSYSVRSHWSCHNGKPQTEPSNEDKGSSLQVASDKPDNGKTEQRFVL